MFVIEIASLKNQNISGDYEILPFEVWAPFCSDMIPWQTLRLLFSLLTAVYNWPGETRYGLPLEIGETVQILEECAGKFHSIRGNWS
jgi:hypothetical protein